MGAIVVAGNVGNDPELKFIDTARGSTALATFALAHTAKSKQGDKWVDGETTWYRVTAWGEKAEAIADSIRKGMRVLVTGSIKQSSFEGRDGTTKTALEINVEHIGIVPSLKGKREDTPSKW